MRGVHRALFYIPPMYITYYGAINFSHTMLHGTRRGAIHRARAESVAAIGLFRRCRAVHAIKKRPMRGVHRVLFYIQPMYITYYGAINFSHTMLHGTRRGAIYRARVASVAAIELFRRCHSVRAIKNAPCGASIVPCFTSHPCI